MNITLPRNSKSTPEQVKVKGTKQRDIRQYGVVQKREDTRIQINYGIKTNTNLEQEGQNEQKQT